MVRKKGMANTPAKIDFLTDVQLENIHLVIDPASGRMQRSSFVPCIQMNADTDQHDPKRKMIPATNFKVLKAVII